jgi:hypothetical protein
MKETMDQLLASTDCRYDFKGSYRPLSKAEEANWWARQEMVSGMRRPQTEVEIRVDLSEPGHGAEIVFVSNAEYLSQTHPSVDAPVGAVCYDDETFN